ncbi:hypothetical protein QM787_22270 [Rhodococcus ruber]|uniref:Uncharacterized protein n=1 Tax=Rhodococcus ruber TaxID=1830 RepID=A0A098BGW8_9NOCA|nr:hypothetical protein [Rhodococcus ruber]ETT25805.1 hypothetical protein RR21198_3550 [Rhodococcus rhodochrous ATCC 21198]MCD2129538.1 hypothetical protein [Rhodococcus ruber]MCZ4505418.1 hypothetical protein [Rhodococcus ruber]MCZ4532849.1 hypothetical protein [Rhodococcus ruber]MCZ4532884.1 hypothetical protein [Rhodococcus ruber]
MPKQKLAPAKNPKRSVRRLGLRNPKSRGPSNQIDGQIRSTSTGEPVKVSSGGNTVIGVSSVTGREVTLAEAVAAAKARVAADRLIPDARTPEAIVRLSKIEIS